MSKKSKNKRSRSEKILSVNISNLSEREILKVIDARIKKRKRTVIYTPNTQILLSADRSRAETALLNSASINIPDGAGLVLASRLLGGSDCYLIGDLIEEQFKLKGVGFHAGSATSLVLMIVVLISMGILNQFDNDEMEETIK